MNGCYNVELPEGFLDNDFRDADLDRFLDEFEHCDPSVAVVGDAYSMDDAQLYNEVVENLREDYPYKTFVVAPKEREAAEELDEDIVLGFANGYSDIQGEDLGYSVFRGRDVHLLGSSPFEQYEAIQKLTQPNLNGDPPANVVGVDWNGPHKVAYKGEYWSLDGWQPADHLSIRETVRESLKEIKAFWQDKNLWPTTTPVEIQGLPVEHPDDPVYAVSGSDIETREDLEESYIINRGGQTLAFESDTAKKFFEYREGYL